MNHVRIHCGDCHYWDIDMATEAQGVQHSLCRRRSPEYNRYTGRGSWPLVHANDWCGHGELRITIHQTAPRADKEEVVNA